MGEHLGPVLAAVAAERLDPVGRPQVAVGARGPRQLAVRDVADHQVEELVLRGPRDRRAGLAAHELLAFERVQPLLQLPALAARQSREPVAPEHLAEHRRVLHERLLPGRELVEPGRDDALHRLG